MIWVLLPFKRNFTEKSVHFDNGLVEWRWKISSKLPYQTLMLLIYYYLGKKSSFTWGKCSFIQQMSRNWRISFFHYLIRVQLPWFGMVTVCRASTWILRGLVMWTFVQLFSTLDWYHSPFLFPMLCDGQKFSIWSDIWT